MNDPTPTERDLMTQLEKTQRALYQSIFLNRLVYHEESPAPGTSGSALQTKSGFVGPNYYPDLYDIVKGMTEEDVAIMYSKSMQYHFDQCKGT